MDPAVDSKPRRSWSERRLLLTLCGLVSAVLVLLLGLFGVARSARFLSHALAAVGEAGQIAAENTNTVRAGKVESPVSTTAPKAERAAVAAASGMRESFNNAASTAGAPAAAPTSSEGFAAMASEGGGGGAPPSALAGSGGVDAGEPTSAGSGGGGASPTTWETIVHSALTLLEQTTISMCGPNTCNAGQVCCNASCGTCVSPGASCDQRQCSGAPRAPTAVLCGATQCNDGQVCCNASCGTCAAPGETCSQQPCR